MQAATGRERLNTGLEDGFSIFTPSISFVVALDKTNLATLSFHLSMPSS
jgi:hypothetical protein